MKNIQFLIGYIYAMRWVLILLFIISIKHKVGG